MQLLGPFSAQHSLRQSSSTFARTSGIFLLSDHQLAVLCLKNGQKTRLVSKDCNFTIFYHISPISNSFTHFSLSSSGITYQKNTEIAILDDVPSPRKDFNRKNWECLGVPNDPKWKVHTEKCLFSSIFWVTWYNNNFVDSDRRIHRISIMSMAGKSTIYKWISQRTKPPNSVWRCPVCHCWWNPVFYETIFKIPLNHSKSH